MGQENRKQNCVGFGLLGYGSQKRAALAPQGRTSTHAVLRLRCAERNTTHIDHQYPVKLVVFDFDETLTMATFMKPSGDFLPNEHEWAIAANFLSPWAGEGSRVKKMQDMFARIVNCKGGQRRSIAILTKNSHKKGLAALIGLLQLADLLEHISVIWAIASRPGLPSGAYKVESTGEWKFFETPIAHIKEHKVDVLQHVAAYSREWFPQLKGGGDNGQYSHLLELKAEGIVLVDDLRANFQNDRGQCIPRYAKVARYDEEYMNMGLIQNMGGIGAHDDADYDALVRFVEDPWMCKETLQVRCQERMFEGNDQLHPVSLVVFDFDETLTLATFMPMSTACVTDLGWSPQKSARAHDWSESDLVKYNFESPFVDGSRVKKLDQMLESISKKRTLAILTQNPYGAVAVINLLSFAGLAKYFSAVWVVVQNGGTMQDDAFQGAYQEAGKWKLFTPPMTDNHKADVLEHLVKNPMSWFPQLHGEVQGPLKDLVNMKPESIVLVDDERANFRNCKGGDSQAKVLRYCKVARYDEIYRDCGALNQMGGIGAHSHTDYDTLQGFLEKPWEYPYQHLDKAPQAQPGAHAAPTAPPVPQVERYREGEEAPKATRVRSIVSM